MELLRAATHGAMLVVCVIRYIQAKENKEKSVMTWTFNCGIWVIISAMNAFF